MPGSVSRVFPSSNGTLSSQQRNRYELREVPRAVDAPDEHEVLGGQRCERRGLHLLLVMMVAVVREVLGVVRWGWRRRWLKRAKSLLNEVAAGGSWGTKQTGWESSP